MDSGQLNKRLTIRTLTQSTDGTGFVTNDSTADTEIWAKITPLNGKRLFEAGREFNGTAYEITVRYDAITSVTNIGDYQLIYNSNTLKIHSWTVHNEDNYWSTFIAVKA